MIISEEMLRESAGKAAQLYLERIDVEYGQESEHVFSRRFERRMRRIIKDQKRSPAQRKFISIMQKVAVAVLVLLVGTFTTTMSVKAYRREFINFITSITHRATRIEYRIGDVEYYSVDLNKTVFGYIPQGYEATQADIIDDNSFNTFANSNGDIIHIDIYEVTDHSSGAVYIDTEKAEVTYPVIDGEETILSQKPGKIMLVGSKRNVIYLISGWNLLEEDIIKIAENIRFAFEEKENPDIGK